MYTSKKRQVKQTKKKTLKTAAVASYFNFFFSFPAKPVLKTHKARENIQLHILCRDRQFETKGVQSAEDANVN